MSTTTFHQEPEKGQVTVNTTTDPATPSQEDHARVCYAISVAPTARIADFQDRLRSLAAPLSDNFIEWRVGTSTDIEVSNDGYRIRPIPYLTKSAVHQTLDTLFGVENWRTTLHVIPGQSGVTDHAFMLDLSIRVPREDGTFEWVAKADGAGSTDYEPIKGGITDALKRAAKQWGLGRYLDTVMRSLPWAEQWRTAITKYPEGSAQRHASVLVKDPTNSKKRLRLYFIPPDIHGKRKATSSTKASAPPTQSKVDDKIKGALAIVGGRARALDDLCTTWSKGNITAVTGITTAEDAESFLSYVTLLQECKTVAGVAKLSDLDDTVRAFSSDLPSVRGVNRNNIVEFHRYVTGK